MQVNVWVFFSAWLRCSSKNKCSEKHLVYFLGACTCHKQMYYCCLKAPAALSQISHLLVIGPCDVNTIHFPKITSYRDWKESTELQQHCTGMSETEISIQFPCLSQEMVECRFQARALKSHRHLIMCYLVNTFIFFILSPHVGQHKKSTDIL